MRGKRLREMVITLESDLLREKGRGDYLEGWLKAQQLAIAEIEAVVYPWKARERLARELRYVAADMTDDQVLALVRSQLAPIGERTP